MDYILILCIYTQLCLTLWGPMDCSPPGSYVHGISQARILEWVAVSFYRGSSEPRDWAHVFCISCIGRQILYHCATWEAQILYTVLCLVAQLCLTLCNPMDCSTPGFPVHHQLPEFTQTHVHWVSEAIQPSHPLSSPSPHTLNLSQHQGLFKWVILCIRRPKYWSFSFTISSSNK